MHVVDMFIMISIGQVVGWLATIYTESDERRLAGHLLATTAGAFVGGYLSLWLVSEFSKASMILCAFLGAGALLYFLRYRKRGLFAPELRQKDEISCRGCGTALPQADATPCPHFGKSDPTKFHWSDISLRKQGPPIAMAIIFMVALFIVLGWFKSLEIKGPQLDPNRIEARE